MTGDADARAAATAIARRLTEAGHQALFAGGCVRDRLLGIEPADYDIATDARPERVLEVFPRARRVGEAFGVILVRSQGIFIEVATFRSDGTYVDGRRPESVTFSDAEADAQRRDFTINGIFEDPLTGRILDYVGGRADIAARRVRAIGDPAARLHEDQLRILRAIRFAARFEFAIEEATADAIRAGASELRGVSRERIGHEVRRMLGHANRGVAAWEMQYLGADAVVLGEPNQLCAPHRLGRLPDDAPATTALAAWLLDRRADPDGSGPAEPWIEVTDRWSRGLLLSNAERDAFRGALEVREELGRWTRFGVARQKRLAASPHFDAGLLLLRSEDRQAFVDVRRRVVELAETVGGLAPPPLLGGQALIAAGFAPGPQFARVLTQVYDAQLEGTVSTPEEALKLARALLEGGLGDPEA